MGIQWLGSARRNIFKTEVLIRLENTILRLTFAYTAFHKRAMLLILYTEYAKSMLDILSDPESAIGPPWLVPEKTF